jgi:hypothetical protein
MPKRILRPAPIQYGLNLADTFAPGQRLSATPNY